MTPGGVAPEAAPGWFRQAVAVAPQHRDLELDGVRIHYRRWGSETRPALVLVHGAAAHSGWWDHVAPQLTAHRVVALDLSGHGDSGHRARYDVERWAAEILAVVAAEDLHRPILIGHSMGGRAAVAAGVADPAGVAAVILVDSPLSPRHTGGRYRPARPARVYPTVHEAVSRFRTRPAQDRLLDYVREHVARGSLRPAEGGWTWKADQRVFGRRPSMQELLPRLRCPLALLRGQHGRVPADMVAAMSRLAPLPLPVVDLPDTGHHPMLDRPLTLVGALRSLLAVWPGP